MDIKQLESVYWVHKLGSFSAAAAYLNTTQPNISGRIQALERELAITIFDRANRQAKLTGPGYAILGEAERIIDAMRELRRFASGKAGLQGTVRVGLTNTGALTWMPELFRRVTAKYSNIDIDFHVDTYLFLVNQFRDHEIDLLVCTEHVSGADIVSKFLYRTSLDWVTSTGTAFRTSPVTAQELLEHRLITFPRGTRSFNAVTEFFKPTGSLPARISTSNSMSAMMQLVASGVGVCTMPAAAVDAHYADSLRVLKTEAALTPLSYYITYRHDPLNQIVPLVAEVALEICGGLPAP